MKAIGKEVDNMGGVLKIWAIKPNEIILKGNTVELLNEANVYPREIVKRGLAHNAAKIIILLKSFDFNNMIDRSPEKNIESRVINNAVKAILI